MPEPMNKIPSRELQNVPSALRRSSKSDLRVLDDHFFLRFSDPDLEYSFKDWTVRKTWRKSLSLAINQTAVVGACAAYHLLNLPGEKYTADTTVVFMASLFAFLNLCVQVVASIVKKYKVYARKFNFYEQLALLILLQWFFCYVYSEPTTYIMFQGQVLISIAIGLRHPFHSTLAMAVISTTGFIILFICFAYAHSCSPFAMLSIVVAVSQVFQFSFICREQERTYRDEYVRSVNLEKSLRDSTLEIRKLQKEKDQLLYQTQTNIRAKQKSDLDTPLETVLSKLKRLRTEATSFETKDELLSVITTLSSTSNILQPSIANDIDSVGRIDTAVSQWLTTEINVRKQSVSSTSSRPSITDHQAPMLPGNPELTSSDMDVNMPHPLRPAAYIMKRRSVSFASHSPSSAALGNRSASITSNSAIIIPATGPQSQATTRISLPLELLTSNHNELDDALQFVCEWDAFDLQLVTNLTRGKPLYSISMAIFEQLGLFNTFPLDRVRLVNFLKAVEDGYHDVPYHNNIHAADVTQAIGFFLKHTSLRQCLTQLDVMACILAAIVHDLGHLGLNNSYEVATSSERALVYNDRSVWENYHLSRAFMLLRSDTCDFLRHMLPNDKRELRKSIIACVMATDLGQHFDHMGVFKTRSSGGKEGFTGLEGRQITMNMAMKVADIGNAGRKFAVYMRWVDRVMDEFFAQGDKERVLSMPISPWMDRTTPQIRLCQCGFLDFIVLPTYSAWVKAFPEAKIILSNAEENRQYWREREQEQLEAVAKAAAVSQSLPTQQQQQQQQVVVADFDSNHSRRGSIKIESMLDRDPSNK